MHIFLVERVAFHSRALCKAQDVFRVKRVRVIILCSLPSRSLMSLLNIPHCSFPQVLSSPNGSISRPSASTTSMGRGFRENPPASPLAGVGCVAEWLTQVQTHMQAFLTRKLQRHWQWQEERPTDLEPEFYGFNTAFQTSLDVKTDTWRRLCWLPLQLFQLHGDGAHADPPPRQPPRFPVPGRRYRDLHHRFQRRVSSMFGPWKLTKQMAGRVGSTRPPGNWGGFGQRICCNNDFSVHS